MIREFEGVLGDWCHLAHIQQERYVQPPLFPPRSRGGETLQMTALYRDFFSPDNEARKLERARYPGVSSATSLHSADLGRVYSTLFLRARARVITRARTEV